VRSATCDARDAPRSPRRDGNIHAGRLPVAALLVASLAITSGSCAPSSRRTPDDTLVVITDTVAKDLDPRFASNNYDTKLSRLIAPGLTTIDAPDLEPRLELAAAIDQVDDLTWDVTVRDDVRFSTGIPVTADDVVFTFMTSLDPAFGGLVSKNLGERFIRVEALDPRRARFHLVKKVATLMSDLDFGILSRASAGTDGRYPPGWVYGAGPYAIDAMGTDWLRLVRNEHYHGAPPPLPFVMVRTVRDQNARAMMLVGGSADLVQNGVRLELVDDIASRDRVAMTAAPSAILSYMMLNGRDPIFADVRVRKAFALAIDRERIIEAKFNGHAVLATGLIPPGHWVYEPDVVRYDHDPARAKALLDEAGFVDPDGDGPLTRVNPHDGLRPLQITYKTSADQFRVAVARVIAAQLREIGVPVEVRAFEFGTFFADIKKGNYQIATMQTSDITEPDYYYTYFNSVRIPGPKNPDGNNRWAYANKRVDELTEAGRLTFDRAERLAIYREVQQIVADEVPVIALWHEDNVVLYNSDVEGYEMFPSARLSGLAKASKKAK
jgi:peptide/nickel transport system substrate-binding protein